MAYLRYFGTVDFGSRIPERRKTRYMVHLGRIGHATLRNELPQRQKNWCLADVGQNREINKRKTLLECNRMVKKSKQVCHSSTLLLRLKIHIKKNNKMKSKSILIFAVSVLLSVPAFASTNIENKENANVETVQMTGSIKDYKNNETLVGATVYVDGKKYYSDLDGNFYITNMKPGEYQIKVELISYQAATVEIEVKKDEAITIKLDRI